MFSEYIVNQYRVERNWKIVYAIILILSQLMALLIPLIYWSSKKCRHHPAQIVLFLCVMEMISTWQLFFQAICLTDFINWVSLYKWVEITEYDSVFKLTSEQFPQYMCWWNSSIFFLCLYAQMSYYVVLCVDLMITLSRPFQNSKTRLWTYHLLAFIVTISFFLSVVLQIKDFCNNPKQLQCNGNFINIEYTQTIILQTILTFVAFISLIYGVKILLKIRKTNNDLVQTKRKYIKNHMLMIFALVIMWMPPLIYNLINFKNKNLYGQKSIYQQLSFVMLLAHPIIFTIVRLQEPYFYIRIKYYLLLVINKITQFNRFELFQLEDEYDEAYDQWLVPLTKLVSDTTNQQTVSNILESILKVVEYDYPSDFQTSLSDLQKIAKVNKKKTLQSSNSVARKLTIKKILKTSQIQDFDEPLNDNQLSTIEYEVIEHAPQVIFYFQLLNIKLFQYLREQDGISLDKFRESLDIHLNLNQISKTQESLGRSGSFFFYSHDRSLILKTLKYEELQLLVKECTDFLFLSLQVLPKYFLHLKQNSSSLIARMYGAYTVQIEGLSSIYLVLMENSNRFIEQSGCRTYDLKGSQENRYVDPKQNQVLGGAYREVSFLPENLRDNLITRREVKTHVQKDINFLKGPDHFLQLQQDIREEMMEILKNDVEMFKSLNIMDYSLLICLNSKESLILNSLKESTQMDNLQFNQSLKFRTIITENKIISISIIDYLQQYNLQKMLEAQYKYFFSKNPSMISCVNSEQYGQRFVTFINSVCINFIDF